MAATTTNNVSSLSQAHFDEILVLMEHDSTCKTILQQLQDVLILVLVEHDSYIGEVVLGLLVVLILVLMEHDNSTLYNQIEIVVRFERRNGGDHNEQSEFLVASPFRRNLCFSGTRQVPT